jgi:hypothetical protein
MRNSKSVNIRFIIWGFLLSISCNAQQKKIVDACMISKDIDNLYH